MYAPLMSRDSLGSSAGARVSHEDSKDSGDEGGASTGGPARILAFVNRGSGGRRGADLLAVLKGLLGPERVFDLAEAIRGEWSIRSVLARHEANAPGTRVLVCGGDGTIGWLLSEIDKLGGPGDCLVGCMPLGTGNDLARQTGWGGRFTRHMSTQAFLDRVAGAATTMLDRWDVSVRSEEDMTSADLSWVPPSLEQSRVTDHPPQLPEVAAAAATVEEAKEAAPEGSKAAQMSTDTTTPDGDGEPESPPVTPTGHTIAKGAPTAPGTAPGHLLRGVFCNYLSIGVDAAVMYSFHRARKTHPGRFTGRHKNQAIFAVKGARHCCGQPTLSSTVEIELEGGAGGSGAKTEDGRRRLVLPADVRAVVLLNLQSYAGGKDLWGRKRGCRDPSADDGVLEIVGFRSSPHIGCTYIFNSCGARAIRLGQAAAVHIRTRRRLAAQIDGEPWLQDPGSFTVSHRNRVTMLRG